MTPIAVSLTPDPGSAVESGVAMSTARARVHRHVAQEEPADGVRHADEKHEIARMVVSRFAPSDDVLPAQDGSQH
jgi:hypothetical protein